MVTLLCGKPALCQAAIVRLRDLVNQRSCGSDRFYSDDLREIIVERRHCLQPDSDLVGFMSGQRWESRDHVAQSTYFCLPPAPVKSVSKYSKQGG